MDAPFFLLISRTDFKQESIPSTTRTTALHPLLHAMSSLPSGTGSSTVAWTYIAESGEGQDQLSAQDVRAGFEKGTDDVKLQLLRHVITSTLNGTPYVSVSASEPAKAKRSWVLAWARWKRA